MSYWDGWTDAKMMANAAAAGDAAVQRQRSACRDASLQRQIDSLKAEMALIKKQRDVAWAAYAGVQKSIEAMPIAQRQMVEGALISTFDAAFDARAAELKVSEHGLASTVRRRLLGR